MLSFAGGFTNSLIALDWNTYLKVEGGLAQFPNGTVPDSAYGHPPEQLPKNVVQPGYLKYVAFMAVIYFVGEQIHPTVLLQALGFLHSGRKYVIVFVGHYSLLSVDESNCQDESYYQDRLSALPMLRVARLNRA